MSKIRARIAAIEKRFYGTTGVYRKRKPVKVYIGVGPDDWDEGPRMSVEDQLTAIERGTRGYLVLTKKEALEHGIGATE